ncbi:unnamed protein product [Rhizoctonia solani]|uniref:Uncharacterized protein n=2 Tax=Rhizoctonia solani TaxID=456999 RepID=A0A8H3H4Y6_9AGAM
MNSETKIPNDFDLELLEAQGGNISPDHFDELLSQLEKSGSLDYANQQALGAPLGELDIVYIVLRKGYIFDLDKDYNPQYTGVLKNEADYWLAGIGCLRISQAASGSGNAAEILVSLLPRAQKSGCGRFLVQKLVQYAFETLRGSICRVAAPIICPVQPHYNAALKKRILFKTKELCWIFEKCGFMFEGITRGAVQSCTGGEGGEPVWYDIHRMSILDTDYFDGERSYTHASQGGALKPTVKPSPWESMIQRQEEEKREMELRTDKPPNPVLADDACDAEGQGSDESDDETVLGGDDDSDWEDPDDFDD